MPQHATRTSFKPGHKRSEKSIEKQRRTLLARYASGALKAVGGGPWSDERREKHAKTKRETAVARGHRTPHGAYWVVMTPDGQRYEHRVIMERVIGRRLRRGEVVHHVDGDGRNNDPANLELMPSQAAHASAHKIKTWTKKWEHCRECLETVRPHGGGGLCHICYNRAWKKRKKN